MASEPRPASTPESTTPSDDGTLPDTASYISDPRWRGVLDGTEPGFVKGRRFFRMIPSSPRCKLCAAPFAGPGAPVMRLMDPGPWAKNPNICGLCFKQLERDRGGAEIDLTLLFADIRSSTTLAETMEPTAFHRLMVVSIER